MYLSVSVDIDAPAERVWSILSDVSHWPDWTPTVTRVERLDDGPFGVGSRARVLQPKLQPMIWTVDRLEPGRSFAWTGRTAGLAVVGDHVVEPLPGGRSRVTLSIAQRGLLEPLARVFYGKLSRQYVETEGASLKRLCEAQVAAAA